MLVRIPVLLVYNLLALLFFALRWPLWRLSVALKRKRVVVRLRPPGRIRLQQATGWLAWVRRTPTWFEWVEEMPLELARDPRVDVVLLDLREHQSGLSGSALVAAQVDALRASGKRVAVLADTYEMPTYRIASHADEVLMTPPGRLGMLGMQAQTLFMAELFSRLGVRAQFVHIGAYKTAAHGYTRREMSGPQRENLEALIGGLWSSLRDEIAEGRASRLVEAGLDDAERRGILEGGRARALGLVDGLLYPDALPEHFGSGPDDKARVIKDTRYTPRPRPGIKPLLPRRHIAVVDMRGVITMGGEGGVSRTSGVTWKRYGALLEKLRESRRVGAVVLHIDSPGGSALASDLLWRSCVRLCEEKPVVVSMGGVAASGGYYIASCGAPIFAQPTTLTGSIGVVAGKFSVGGLVERLWVRSERVGRGERASLFSPIEAFSREDMAALRRDAWAVYRRFVARVAEGREMTRAAVHAVGEGRVFLGAEALSRGLVDRLGDVGDAVAHARELAKMSARAPVEVYPSERQSVLGVLRKGGVSASGAAVLSELEEMLPGVASGELERALCVLSLFQEERSLALWIGAGLDVDV